LLNILVVSTEKYGLNGVSNVIKNLYCNDTFSKQKIIFLLPNGSNISMIDELKSYNYNIVFSNRSKKTIYAYFNLIKKIINENEIDIIHIHGNSHTTAVELLAAKLASCKVRIVHAHNTSCKYIVLHKLLTPIFNRSYTHGFACGADAGRFMFGKRTFTLINNGIDIARYEYKKESRHKIRIQHNLDNKYVIGHVGNFLDVKNQSFLIHILRELLIHSQKYRLVLIGDGKTLPDIKNKAMQLGVIDNIVFTGSIKTVPDYLSACDIFVMPSLFEGFPLSLVEAQANGLQCICSDVITRDVNLTGNVCFLSLDKGPKIWAETIINTKYAERKKTSKKAIKRIKEAGYSIGDEVFNLENYYLKALKSVNNSR
jgi:glycosyltransferase involved in cell wall biosynthesis